MSIIIDRINSFKCSPVEKLQSLWKNGEIDEINKVFIGYMIANKETKFGTAWKEAEQIARIQEWEERETLNYILSSNYDKCISFFYKNKLIYPSEFTGNNNPRKYTLHKSLEKYLFDDKSAINIEVRTFVASVTLDNILEII